MISIFSLKQPADCEGRSERIVGFFATSTLATQIGRAGVGNAAMGPSVGRIEEFVVYETLEEFVQRNALTEHQITKLAATSDQRNTLLREHALAKLSPAERTALGLSA